RAVCAAMRKYRKMGKLKACLPRAGLPARLAAILGTRRAQVHEPIGARNRKVLTAHPIEDRVDRRDGADPETERESGDDGHERCAGERSECEPEVSHGRAGWV